MTAPQTRKAPLDAKRYAQPHCVLCGQERLAAVDAFARLPRVTSDCRPWPAGGSLSCCRACSGVQKPILPGFSEELDRIYAGYVMYAQSGGAEQRALDASGSLDRRSVQILDHFLRSRTLKLEGRWLDVGCGNGATLRAVSERLPGWSLVGTELDDRNRSTVEAIARLEYFHAGPIDDLDDRFDVVSMVHVLEHVRSPITFLKSVLRLLNRDGLILIQLPLSLGNYFDLVIADHILHFEETTLRECVERAGFVALETSRHFFEREFSLAAAPERRAAPSEDFVDADRRLGLLERQVDWLASVATAIERLGERPVGVFGSSIGATFAYAVRRGSVAFFLDEDPDRVGGTHLGVEIRAPENAEPGVPIYVALPPQLARIVKQKPGREEWIVPPTYSAPSGISVIA